MTVENWPWTEEEKKELEEIEKHIMSLPTIVLPPDADGKKSSGRLTFFDMIKTQEQADYFRKMIKLVERGEL